MRRHPRIYAWSQPRCGVLDNVCKLVCADNVQHESERDYKPGLPAHTVDDNPEHGNVERNPHLYMREHGHHGIREYSAAGVDCECRFLVQHLKLFEHRSKVLYHNYLCFLM